VWNGSRCLNRWNENDSDGVLPATGSRRAGVYRPDNPCQTEAPKSAAALM
jgi:hypothetical protein